jgi:excinuclease ABC subunit C
MKGFKFLPYKKIDQLPKTAGVYAFSAKKGVFYIGKAINIKERVKNHFNQPTHRDNLFIKDVKKVGFFETNSEIEALLIEAKLIKKYQPKFNIIWRDDKNYFYVAISKEDLPRVYITHQPQLKINYIGPFVDGTALKKTLRLLRRVFPYYTVKKHSPTPCLWCHLKLCPGPNPNKGEYKKNIRNLVSVLKGKKQEVLKNLKKEMKSASLNNDFEKAAKTRDQIFALEKTLAHSRILNAVTPQPDFSDYKKTEKELKKILKIKTGISRIEGYDVSNIQGKEATASMVVFINGRPEKNLYRKFKIKTIKSPNDIAMIKEALNRRLLHNEWQFPDLILIDGGKAQLNAALNCKWQMANDKLSELTRVVALAKRKNEFFIEGKNEPVLLKSLPGEISNLILQIRDEAHDFAIRYHKYLRKKELFGTIK